MRTLQELTRLINYHANTKVSMHGEIDSLGHYANHIEGSSPEEIYEFLRYIAVTRSRDFEQVNIRYGKPNPPTFTCYVEFDTNEIDTSKGYIISDCGFCGERIQFESKLAGKTIKCPNCGEPFVIGMIEKDNFDDNSFDEEINTIKPYIDISKVYFKSSEHKRYNSGEWTGHDNRCLRALEIKPDNKYENSYIVTLYNLDGIHPEWRDNLSMSPKRMRIVSSDKNQITLKGYGYDPMLSQRPSQIQKDYGIKIHLKNESIDYISYFLLDREVRIDYFK